LSLLIEAIVKSKSFSELAFNKNGSHFLRALIQHLPPSDIVGIKHFYEDKNLEEFENLLMGKYSIFVMQCILVKLEMGCQEGVEGAAKRKRQFIRQLGNGLITIKNGLGVHCLETVY